MSTYTPDNSGILSLRGFSFQIKVFVHYLLTLKDGMQIEFETIDDVNVKTVKAEKIDNYNDAYINKIVSNDSNTAIQVKRTSLTESSFTKILHNWTMLESSGFEVNKYVLLTEEEYENTDLLFSRTAMEYFTEIKQSKKKANAIITKVKNTYEKFEDFEKAYTSIKAKYEYVSVNNLESMIFDGYSELFRKAGINVFVYSNRIRDLLQLITVSIMDSINNKKPFILGYSEFIRLIEDICLRWTEEITQPLYINFRKTHSVDFNDLDISRSREYKQLLACELPQKLIERQLGYGEYYRLFRLNLMEINNLSKIEIIEQTTFDNFDDIKFHLQKENRDEPYNRLHETQNASNNYADNDQLRYGSGIYLTRIDIDNTEIQISWKDDENESTQA